MAAGGKWTREETLAALALYLSLPPARIDDDGPEVIELANALGRTPGAVALKIFNLRANDPERISKGMDHASKLDAEIMAEYVGNVGKITDAAADALESLVPDFKLWKLTSEVTSEQETLVGEEKLVLTTARIHQSHFRNLLLENYSSRCCISGVGGKGLESLLVASHIKPWKVSDSFEKVSPDNGLLLNAFWDKAFDQGLITLNYDYEIVVSGKVPHDSKSDAVIWSCNGNKIALPNHAAPRKEFIEYHNDVVFKG